MTLLENIYGPLISGLVDVVNYIGDLAHSVYEFFNDLDFSVFYSWMPQDLQTVISGLIAFLVVLALISLLKKFTFFVG